jgi:hypothetical protein
MDTEHTLYVYRKDGRRRTGERLELSQDFDSKIKAERFARQFKGPGYRFEISKSYHTVTNLMTGAQTQERADTPLCCSVSSETYWSM